MPLFHWTERTTTSPKLVGKRSLVICNSLSNKNRLPPLYPDCEEKVEIWGTDAFTLLEDGLSSAEFA